MHPAPSLDNVLQQRVTFSILLIQYSLMKNNPNPWSKKKLQIINY